MIWDGRYEIERTLGEGGMGEVLLARDLARGGRPVALKVLRPEFHDVTPGFLHEYTLQRSLRHPGVPDVYEFGYAHTAEADLPYFAMEHVSGVSLHELISPAPPLERVWRWTIEVLRVLDRMHRLGYVHRDIKPANILVDPAKDDHGVHVIDYGIAISVGAPREDFFVGTPEYCAPEVLALEPCDGRADLYALGLVLYELLQGAPPWPGSEPQALYDARIASPPRPLERAHIPADMADLIFEMLSPLPRDRPEHAAAVIERLAAAVDLPPVIETPVAFQMALESRAHVGPAYRAVAESTSPIVAVELAPGRRGQAMIHEIADQRAIRGVRVVRLDLSEDDPDGDGGQLAQLAPALDVFKRLRADRVQSVTALPGLAGAATLLSRMHGPTLFVVEQLQLAEPWTLALLDNVFTEAGNYELRILATVDHGASARAPEALARLLDRRFVDRVALTVFDEPRAGAWVASVLQSQPPEPAVRAWFDRSGGGRTRLVHQLVSSFERGDIRRRVDGYDFSPTAWTGPKRSYGARGPDAVEAARIRDELADLVSAIAVPLPYEVAERYLGGLTLHALVDDGVVRQIPSGWIIRERDPRHVERWDGLSPRRQGRLSQRLADAIAAGEDFPGRSALLADVYARTQRPAQAVPSLMRAADEAIASGDEEAAIRGVQRAQALMSEDAADDDVGQDWRVHVAETEVRMARRFGRPEALGRAGDALFALGAELAHVPTLRQGVFARLEYAQRAGRWERLHEDAWALLDLGPDGPSQDDEAMSRWGRAWHAWARGDAPGAKAVIDEAVAFADKAATTVQLEVYALRAALAVSLRERSAKAGAVTDYRAAAERAKDRAHVALARVAEARGRRHEGHLTRALTELERASVELGAFYGKRVNAALELERAASHLELGWWKRAANHARRAAGLAHGCDPRAGYQANVVLLRALVADRDIARASAEVAPTLGATPPQCLPHDRYDAVLALLELRCAQRDDPEAINAEAVDLARTAQTTQDGFWTVRAATLATRLAVRHGAPLRAVKLADWLRDANTGGQADAVPLHLVRALRAQAHYRMKWFASAKILSHSAMQALRAAAERIRSPEHRKAWLAVPDNQVVGLDRWPARPDGTADGARERARR